MESVSFYLKGNLNSKYFDIEYNFENNDFNKLCEILVQTLAMVDVAPTGKNIEKLHIVYKNVFSKCEIEEIEKFRLFLEKLSKIGGYARIFFEEINSSLNINGKIEASKLVRNSKTVTSYSSKGIESPYYDYKTSKKFSVLDMHCSVFITYMALVDLIRDEMMIKSLNAYFYKCLAICQNEEEIMKFKDLVLNLSSMGGYAYLFLLEHEEDFTLGKSIVLKKLDYSEN